MPAEGRMLHEGLHGLDVVLLGHQELLGKLGDLLVAVFAPPGVFQHQDHTPGVALDHHTRDLGIPIAVLQLCSGHHIRHDPNSGLEFRQFPASLGRNGVGFAFNGVILTKLGFQRLSQSGAHIALQHTSDTHLTHLCCFQQGSQHLFAVFHLSSPLSVCPVSHRLHCQNLPALHTMGA